jgi:hypothetical protein
VLAKVENPLLHHGLDAVGDPALRLGLPFGDGLLVLLLKKALKLATEVVEGDLACVHGKAVPEGLAFVYQPVKLSS